MIKEGWSIVRTATEWYFSNGYIWILWICSCIIMLIRADKKIKYLLWYMIVYSVLVFNPVSAIVLSKMGMEGVYWRSFWMVPIGCMVACMFTYIATITKKNLLQGIIICMSAMAVMVCGKLIYNLDNFQKIENWYKIPDDVIEVSDYIEPGNTVLAPLDLMVWLRTYNADIYLPIGRQAYYFSNNVEKNQIINSLSWDETIDVSYIATNAIDYGCRYIVMGKWQKLQGDWDDYGYQLIDQTEQYLIYRR